MAEWWTYTLADFLLFSPRAYYRLLELHNRAAWPAQLVWLALGSGLLFVAGRGSRHADRIVAAVLAAAWLAVAWTFHWQRYATINWAAGYFAAAFAVEAALLLFAGIVRDRLLPGPPGSRGERTALGMAALALLAYPLAAPLVGRPWVQAEVFGLAPDPTVAATLGFALLAPGRIRWLLLAIPLAWCAISGGTLWAMKAPEALVLPVTAFLGLALALPRTS